MLRLQGVGCDRQASLLLDIRPLPIEMTGEKVIQTYPQKGFRQMGIANRRVD
jgi:hypothetical protein